MSLVACSIVVYSIFTTNKNSNNHVRLVFLWEKKGGWKCCCLVIVVVIREKVWIMKNYIFLHFVLSHLSITTGWGLLGMTKKYQMKVYIQYSIILVIWLTKWGDVVCLFSVAFNVSGQYIENCKPLQLQ